MNSQSIREDENEEEVDEDSDDSSSYLNRGDSVKKSTDLRGQLQSLRDEHEELKRDFEIVQDKNKILEEDIRALQIQNRSQKLELDMLNNLVEINKKEILKSPETETSKLVEDDPK